MADSFYLWVISYGNFLVVKLKGNGCRHEFLMQRCSSVSEIVTLISNHSVLYSVSVFRELVLEILMDMQNH